MNSRPTPRARDGIVRRGAVVVAQALRSAPRPFAWGMAGATLYAGMTVASSLVLGWVTDEVILPAFDDGAYDRGLLALGLAGIVGVATLKSIGVFGRRYGAYVAQYGLQADYRRQVTRRYLQLPISWHRRHPTGELLSNANADVESAFFVAAPLPMAFGATLLLLITGFLLVATDPFLAAIGFSVGPLLGLANWYYQRKMRHAATVAQQARAEVSEVAHESFDAALVVKTMGREAAEAGRFRGISEDLRDKMIVVGRLRAFFDPVIEALPNIGILLILLVGAMRVRDGALNAGALVTFAYLFRLVALPIRVFGWLLGELPRAIVGWDRVQRVLTAVGDMVYGRHRDTRDGGAETGLEEVGYLHPSSDREDLSAGSPDLAVGRPEAEPVAGQAPRAHTGADAGVPAPRGVTGLTFDVEAGRTIALVGPTGSGKSTVAALLVRLYDPDTGVVTFDGRDVRELDRDRLAADVAIVFQEAFLFDDTIRENITLGADHTDEEVEAAARLAQAHDFVSSLPDGYDTEVGERGASLSGGQRQRIALARALIRKPRLLVLDDATSAVDPSVESAILRGLSDAALPSTVVVVAYRRGSIALADEVVFVRDGRIAGRGAHVDLVRDVPAYAALVTAYEEQAREADAERRAHAGGGTRR
ncbi:multidrug ABC transporter ATP-binding protein [Egicoccus halophilus]|uniref:Multidrug ABC transporter ATP-binding protein n=1 Tax=Egicoccus halophilus TaxID=1670830 RepID=A0A8J3EU31_9ACTN|nr:ABC transporter ATP-binding protein [Egicoccus halophilus]GGI06825.1 multidrug ABC transporter ATP-binding protein [Egicoccus halophilus]